MTLTVTALRNTRPKLKPLRLYDSGGLYVEIAPSGGRWWRFAYRFAGKRKLLSLGVYPEVSLAEARERRDATRKILANGIDPSTKRKADKREKLSRIQNSFEVVAREWYKKQVHVWVAHHAADVLRRLESNLFPHIGYLPIAEVTAPALLAAVRKIEHRGAHDLAHRILQVAGQVFRYGIATGRCERDLSSDLRGALSPHKANHQAAITPEELPELLRAIESYRELGEGQTSQALRLLALTFVRTNELIGAKWNEFDLDSGIWIIPALRMKMKMEHVVPLSSQAIEILREIKAATSATSSYVFPGRNPDKPISNNTMLFALYRMGYKGKMTGHGFRSIASTMLNEAGFRADVIERQLAHGERNAIRGAYNRAEYLAERKAMMQQWADMLDALRGGAQVIPLQRKVLRR